MYVTDLMKREKLSECKKHSILNLIKGFLTPYNYLVECE